MVDVRQEWEWRESYIPLEELQDPVNELPRDRPLVLQCARGNRSRVAAETLQGLDYDDIHNLEGGITAWTEAGLPIER